jgi:N-acyl homoserine lactone hydrolase
VGVTEIGLKDVLPLHLADFTFPPQHPLAGERGLVYGFAVRHPAGVFLFDTGVGVGNGWIEENYKPNVRRIDDVLRGAGVGPGEVVAVANSHLHFDHAGQNARFTGTRIFVQRIERLAAQADGYTVADWVNFPGARYETIDGEGEPLPGIRLVPTPGHTRGHQSAVVATREGPVVLAGQAVYSVAEWRGESDTAERTPRAAESVRRLKSLRPRRVFFAHDAAAWDAA